MQKQSIVIEPHKSIKEFRLYLLERENAPATIDKYLTDINTFCRFLDYNYEISKQRILEYKDVAAGTLCCIQCKFYAGSTFAVSGISGCQFHEGEADEGAETDDSAGRAAAVGRMNITS